MKTREISWKKRGIEELEPIGTTCLALAALGLFSKETNKKVWELLRIQYPEYAHLTDRQWHAKVFSFLSFSTMIKYSRKGGRKKLLTNNFWKLKRFTQIKNSLF